MHGSVSVEDGNDAAADGLFEGVQRALAQVERGADVLILKASGIEVADALQGAVFEAREIGLDHRAAVFGREEREG